MGYRLDIYKNSSGSNDNNLFYGTKLIGYVDYKECDLLCVQYIVSLGKADADDFGYYFAPELDLSRYEFIRFFILYTIDLCNYTEEEHQLTEIEYMITELYGMLSVTDVDDRFIVGGC